MSLSFADPETVATSPTQSPKIVATSNLSLKEGSFKCLVEEGGYKIEFKSGYKPWKLSGYTPSASRIRDSFKTLKEAAGQRKSQIRQDEGVTERTHIIETGITQHQAEDAETALKILDEIPSPSWEEDKWTLTLAAKFVKARFRSCRTPKDAVTAIDEFEAAKLKGNRRAATLNNWRPRLKQLRKALEGKMVHEATGEDLRPLIVRGNAGTQGAYKKRFRHFFNWCAKDPRYYTAHNPCDEITLDEDETIEDESPVVLLPVPKVRSFLFDALTFRGGRIFPYVLIGTFQSVRPAEMVRCQARIKMFGEHWAHFGETEEENFIDVIGKVRTRRTRQVRMYAALARIAKRFVDAGYPLVPNGWYNDWTILRARNGYLGNTYALPKHFNREALIRYAKDAMRHTGTSHKLIACKSEGETGLWSGDRPDQIYANYKGKVTEKENRDFLQILEDLLAVLPSLEELIRQGVPDMISNWECAAANCPVDKPNTFSLPLEDYNANRAAYLQEHPEAAQLKEPTRRRGNFYTRRMEVARGLPSDRKELIRLLWTNSRKELSIKLALSVQVYDGLFGDDLKLPLPGQNYFIWRAGGMSLHELPLEVQEAFPEGVPLSNDRKYIPLPELLKLAWEIPKDRWSEQIGFGFKAIQHRLRGLPLPRNLHWQEMPDDVKLLVAMSETELVELAKKNRGDEDESVGEELVEVPVKVTLPMLLKRVWEVPKRLIRKEWKIGRRVMESMLRGLPVPPKRYWSLFQRQRVVPDLVNELAKMSDEELKAWKRAKLRELYPSVYKSKEKPDVTLASTFESIS
jgi:hypothetical protein